MSNSSNNLTIDPKKKFKGQTSNVADLSSRLYASAKNPSKRLTRDSPNVDDKLFSSGSSQSLLIPKLRNKPGLGNTVIPQSINNTNNSLNSSIKIDYV